MVTKTQALLSLLLSVSVTQAVETEEISANYEYFKTHVIEKNKNDGIYEVPAFKTHELKDAKLLHGNNTFSVFDKGEVKKVKPCWVDNDIRSVSKERLEKMLEHGYLSFKKMSDGEFKVQVHVRGEGGGPVAGSIAFWLTNALGCGIASVVIGGKGEILPEVPEAGPGSVAVAFTTVEVASYGMGAFFTALPFLP